MEDRRGEGRRRGPGKVCRGEATAGERLEGLQRGGRCLDGNRAWEGLQRSQRRSWERRLIGEVVPLSNGMHLWPNVARFAVCL